MSTTDRIESMTANSSTDTSRIATYYNIALGVQAANGGQLPEVAGWDRYRTPDGRLRTITEISQGDPDFSLMLFPYTLPDLTRFNFRWSAEPGIDLFGSSETAVRAYHESYYITSFAHSTAAGYPGYEKATENLVFDPRRIRDINDRTNYNGLPRAGTAYAHLMSIDETEHGLRAMICEGNYPLMTAGSDGTFNNYRARIPTAILIPRARAPGWPEPTS